MVGQPNDDDGRSDFSAYSVPIIKRPFFKFGEISISKNSKLCILISYIFSKTCKQKINSILRGLFMFGTLYVEQVVVPSICYYHHKEGPETQRGAS